MLLSDFYDRLHEVDPSLKEGLMRSRLQEALETISQAAGAPRARLVFASVEPTENADGDSVPPVVGVPFVVREILRPTVEAGPWAYLYSATSIGADLSEIGVPDLVFAQGAVAPFTVDVTGLPDEVPADVTSEEGAAFHVPWADAALNYILSELYARTEATLGLQRVHYARYQRALLAVKQEVRASAWPSRGLVVSPDLSIW